jgi:hypothetical protein
MGVRLPAAFDRSSASNYSFADVDGFTQAASEGRVHWSGDGPQTGASATFTFLPHLMDAATAGRVLAEASELPLDVRPDSVDGLPAHELYVVRDGSILQPRLHALLRPSLARLTRWVNARSPVCRAGCTPCTSLLRRYGPGGRDSHPEHTDGHAAMTAVTALSDIQACAEPGCAQWPAACPGVQRRLNMFSSGFPRGGARRPMPLPSSSQVFTRSPL